MIPHVNPNKIKNQIKSELRKENKEDLKKEIKDELKKDQKYEDSESELKKLKKLKRRSLRKNIIIIGSIISLTLFIVFSLDMVGGKTIRSLASFLGLAIEKNEFRDSLKIANLQLDRVAQLANLFELVQNPEMDNITFKQLSGDFEIINHSDDNFVTSMPIFKAISKQLKKDGFNALMFGRLYFSTGGRPVWSSSNWNNETDLGVIREYLKDKDMKIFFLGSNPEEIYLSNPFKSQTNGFLTIEKKKSIMFIRKEQMIIKVVPVNKNNVGGFKAVLEDGDIDVVYNFIEEDFYKKSTSFLQNSLPTITFQNK